MEQYLIDTNVISDYFSASLPNAAFKFLDNIIDAVPSQNKHSEFKPVGQTFHLSKFCISLSTPLSKNLYQSSLPI